MKRKIIYLCILLLSITAALYAGGSITGNVSWNVNPKYFTNAKTVLDDDAGWFVSFASVQGGVDGVFSPTSVFGIGADLTARVTNHGNNITAGHPTHIGVEFLLESRFSFGKMGYGAVTPMMSLSLLAGGAFYTNTDVINVVPGGGLKLMVDMYSESSSFIWGFVVRSTFFYFDHKEPLYSCLDSNISVGIRLGYGVMEDYR